MDNNGHKLSKNQKRKQKRYGKNPKFPLNLNNPKKCELDPGLQQFINALLKTPPEEDHSLDEIHIGKRRWPLLPGGFETGKRR